MSETQVTTEAQVDMTDDLDAFAGQFFGENKTPEPAAKPDEASKEAVAHQADATEEAAEGTEAQTEDPDADLEVEEEAPPPPPKKKTVQDRIDELVRQREETKREAAQEIEKLRKDFEAKLEALNPSKPTAKSAEPTPDDTTDKGDPKYPLGEFDPSYIRDLTRFTLEQERAQATIRAEEQRQKDTQAAQSAALQTSWNEKIETAKTRYPDLVEKAQPMLDGFAGLDPSYAGYLATVLQSMDYGPDVLYYLAENPAEATKIVNSGAQKATLALGRIEARYAEADAQKTLAKPKLTKAPPPPAASARGTGAAKPSVAGDTDNLDAFAAEFFKPKRY